MTEYRLSPRAGRDLEDIWRYTAEQWSVDQAEKYVGSLIDAMAALAKNPGRGRSAEQIRPGYRRYSAGAHVIFYRRTSYGIAIVRVLHQRMDIEGQLESG